MADGSSSAAPVMTPVPIALSTPPFLLVEECSLSPVVIACSSNLPSAASRLDFGCQPDRNAEYQPTFRNIARIGGSRCGRLTYRAFPDRSSAMSDRSVFDLSPDQHAAITRGG